jgi:hypothetical protein
LERVAHIRRARLTNRLGMLSLTISLVHFSSLGSCSTLRFSILQ